MLVEFAAGDPEVVLWFGLAGFLGEDDDDVFAGLDAALRGDAV
jgi:hypothetical protein